MTRTGAATRLAATLALISALLTAPRVARADGLADEAELHFQLGTTHYQRGDYTGALEHFLASNRLVKNRRVIFNIAHTYEQLKKHADAHRYYVDALDGETDPRIRKTVEGAIARVTPFVALLDVVTSPPGATIYLDRRDLGSLGRAPKPLAVPPGQYKVIVELAGHEPATSEPVDAKVGASSRVALTLARIEGTVRVAVAGAPSAAVRVDDERAAPACDAPCDLRLSPGTHQLYFTREGYHAAPLQVTVVARATTQATARMSPFTGAVLVRTDEPGALVTIDGRSAGFTPAVIRDVPAGRRAVRVSARGFAPVERTIQIVAGQQAQLPVLTLEPLREVTAVSRYAERIDDAPSSVTVIDGRELRAFGYPTIAEALRGVRGVSLSNDRAYSSAGIRGLGQPNDYGNRLLVLSDGQPLNDNLVNSSYIGAEGRADLHDVDSIEVVRGPGSLLYGAGAVSGVVALNTRTRDAPSGAHLGGGTYDDAVLRARAGFHYNVSPDAGVWASASAAQSDGVEVDVPLKDPPVTRRVRGADAFASGGTAGKAWWGPATMQWFYHRRDQRVPVGAYASRIDDDRNVLSDTRMMAELRVDPRLSESFQLMLRAHANRYEFRGIYTFEGVLDSIEDYYGTWFGGEARLVYSPSPRLRVSAGGEGQAHPQATLLGSEDTLTGSETYLDERVPYTFGAGYGLIEGSPFTWLRLAGGARVDVYSTFGPILVPRAAIILKPVAGNTIKLIGGRAFRAPSIYEQFYNDGGVSEVRSVDPARGLSLGPESVYSGELEIAQRFLEDWALLIAGHASHITGIIRSVADTPGSDLVRYANSDAPALIVGGDAEIRREWRRGWMVAATYAYQRAQILDSSLDDPRLVNAPQHLASIRGVVPFARELAAGALRVTLEAPRRIGEEDSAVTDTQVIADAAISGDVRDFGIHYVVGVYNIADRRHAVPVADTFLSRTMPQNGRTFLLDVIVTYP